MESPSVNQKPEPVGPLVAIFVIVLIFIVGGIYFFVTQETEPQPALPTSEQAVAN